MTDRQTSDKQTNILEWL